MAWVIEALKALGLTVAVFTFLAVVGAMLGVYLERKISGWIQARLGPKHVGPQGLLQTVADTVKLLQKEHITPRHADALMFNAAPVVVAVAALLDWVVIPFGAVGDRVLVVRDLNIGVLYFAAMASLTVIGILSGGWASNNKYALLGALRSASQMVSYEIPLALSIIWVALVAGTLSTVGIVEAQVRQGGWFLLRLPDPVGWWGAPLGLLAALTFLAAATAEVNRVPFDLPEAESELVAGYFAEYTGMRFALFQLGEYGEMFAMAALASVMFFGGWAEPRLEPWMWAGVALLALVVAAVILVTGGARNLVVRPLLILSLMGAVVAAVMAWGVAGGRSPVLPSVVWFALKLFALVFFLMWMRWTYPRLRLDQLLALSWKVLIPVGLANLLATGLVLTVAGR
ncbi:MAG: complex I subunit 1 family protein [Armatimonadota bacterium]|nr:complex I subunit 1 family protein [Armatimonadota bacterium]MDR7401855.1 complex I subunit 1 family protein [Armatimonadota bacterium]MDR7403915.1 complex I subunit 1 family protein [Armatimonadota bacterium]MDR7437429.1 complex I subunit 1 family protein [Armatimonadota bacterium]MDR7473180.1 complex I subunit 1 family protein [Armatimonadota bacterium]